MIEITGRKIAVVGVSENSKKYGHKIFMSLKNEGFKVYAVNPRGGKIGDSEIYRKINDIPDIPDIVITVVMPQITEKIVDECIELGVKEIWMQPGSESRGAIEKAQKQGIKVTSNACIMTASRIW